MHAARSNWPADRGSKRVSRARDPDSKEDVRVTIVLTKADEEYALGRLLTWPTRRFFDRWEWLSAAWIELVSPPDGIETPSQIDVMLKRAVWRAEKKIRADK